MNKFIYPLIAGLIAFIIALLITPAQAQTDTVDSQDVRVRVVHSTHIIPLTNGWTRIIPQGFVLAPVSKTCAELIAESEAEMHAQEDILAAEHERTEWVHKSVAECVTINFARPRPIDIISRSFNCVRVYSAQMEWVFTCQGIDNTP